MAVVEWTRGELYGNGEDSWCWWRLRPGLSCIEGGAKYMRQTSYCDSFLLDRWAVFQPVDLVSLFKFIKDRGEDIPTDEEEINERLPSLSISLLSMSVFSESRRSIVWSPTTAIAWPERPSWSNVGVEGKASKSTALKINNTESKELALLPHWSGVKALFLVGTINWRRRSKILMITGCSIDTGSWSNWGSSLKPTHSLQTSKKLARRCCS